MSHDPGAEDRAGQPPLELASDLPLRLARRLAEPLPQRDVRSRFAPELSYGRHGMPPLPDTRQAAVLVLLYQGDEGWTIPLTLRPETLSVHAGQISLPGGQVQEAETSEQAAWRELEEELGCSTEHFVSLGCLSPVFVYGSNFYVTPWVAAAAQRPQFRPNAAEVERVLELPLGELINPGHRGMHWIRGHDVHFRAPHIDWQGQRIWGATRMILAELAALLDELQSG